MIFAAFLIPFNPTFIPQTLQISSFQLSWSLFSSANTMLSTVNFNLQIMSFLPLWTLSNSTSLSVVLQSTGIQPLPRKTAVSVSLSPRISAQLEILPGFNTQEYKVWWSRGKGCLQWLESTKMVSSCISHMIWGLDEVLTEFLHELCKRLLERRKYTEAQRDLWKQPSDNPVPSDTRTKSKATPKGRES